MNILIIDYDKAAAQQLEFVIRSLYPDASIVDVLHSAEDCLTWFSEPPLDLDLVIMDIRLANGNSFELWNSLNVEFPVIFSIYEDQRLIRELESSRVDYLVKPVDSRQVGHKIKRIQTFSKRSRAPWSLRRMEPLLTNKRTEFKNRFIVKRETILKSIPVGHIAYFLSEQKGIKLVTFDGDAYTVPLTLSSLKNSLDPNLFFRLNNQVTTSRDAIDAITPFSVEQLEVTLIPPAGFRILIGKKNVKPLAQWLDKEEENYLDLA